MPQALSTYHTTSYSKLKFLFVAFVILISSRCWSFQVIPDKVYDACEFLIFISLIVIVILRYGDIRKQSLPFSGNVILFLVIPLISALPAAIFHNQTLPTSISILRTNFFWLLYYVLYIFKIEPAKLIKFSLFTGAVWIIITIVQQFTYPHYYFYTRADSDDQELYRAGVYRYMINPYQFGLFIFLYYYWRLLSKITLKNIFYTLLGIAGFYYYSTRQLMAGIAVCMAVAIAMQKGKSKMYAAVAFGLALVIGLVFKDQLFGSYIEMTNSQLDDKDDIRILAAKYFLFDYWPHWSAFLIGNGFEHTNSDYGKEILYIQTHFYYFKGDVGIFGALNTFGIFYIINIVWTLVKAMRAKLSFENKYLFFVFLFTFLLLLISEQFSYPSAVPFYCVALYLIDTSVYKDNSIDMVSVQPNKRKTLLILHDS